MFRNSRTGLLYINIRVKVLDQLVLYKFSKTELRCFIYIEKADAYTRFHELVFVECYCVDDNTSISTGFSLGRSIETTTFVPTGIGLSARIKTPFSDSMVA